jgi:hypothetical protein
MMLPLRVKEATINQIPKIPVIQARHIVTFLLSRLYSIRTQDAYQGCQEERPLLKVAFYQRVTKSLSVMGYPKFPLLPAGIAIFFIAAWRSISK